MLQLLRAVLVYVQHIVSGPRGAGAPAIKTKLIDILPAQVLP